MTGITRKNAKKIIVLGALSAIGEATARLYAAQGAHLVLAGRDEQRLSQVADDLSARGASKCTVWPLDLAKSDCMAEFKRMIEALGGSVDAVLLFYGVLGDQKLAETHQAEFDRIITVNFSSAVEWASAAARQLEKQDSGTLVAISSVAGDRGRQSNYVYGAAKSGLTTLVQGIAHRLAKTNARAVVIKLGFVDTPMTAHIKKSGPLWAKPDQIAAQVKAVTDNPKKPIVYAPWFWRWIMLIIRTTPAAILHKTNL